MAQKIINISDLSGDVLADTDHTLVWGFDGKTMEIDLTAAEREKMEKALARYIEASRPLGRAARPARTGAENRGAQVTDTPLDGMKGAERTRTLKSIRDWATTQNIEVNARGRMPVEVVQGYFASL